MSYCLASPSLSHLLPVTLWFTWLPEFPSYPLFHFSCIFQPPTVFLPFSLLKDFFQSVSKTLLQVLVLFKSWMSWHVNLVLKNSRFKLQSKFKVLSLLVRGWNFHSSQHLGLFSMNFLVLWLCHDWWLILQKGKVFTFFVWRGQMEPVSFTLKCAKLFWFVFILWKAYENYEKYYTS